MLEWRSQAPVTLSSRTSLPEVERALSGRLCNAARGSEEFRNRALAQLLQVKASRSVRMTGFAYAAKAACQISGSVALVSQRANAGTQGDAGSLLACMTTGRSSALISSAGNPASIYDAWEDGAFTLLSCARRCKNRKSPTSSSLIRPPAW